VGCDLFIHFYLLFYMLLWRCMWPTDDWQWRDGNTWSNWCGPCGQDTMWSLLQAQPISWNRLPIDWYVE